MNFFFGDFTSIFHRRRKYQSFVQGLCNHLNKPNHRKSNEIQPLKGQCLKVPKTTQV